MKAKNIHTGTSTGTLPNKCDLILYHSHLPLPFARTAYRCIASDRLSSLISESYIPGATLVCFMHMCQNAVAVAMLWQLQCQCNTTALK